MIDLCLDTLGELNHGVARAVIDAAIRAAIIDLSDRGSDKKPRKVNITLTLEKISDGELSADVEAKANLPPYLTGKTICELSESGRGAAFNENSPENPRQRTILDRENP